MLISGLKKNLGKYINKNLSQFFFLLKIQVSRKNIATFFRCTFVTFVFRSFPSFSAYVLWILYFLVSEVQKVPATSKYFLFQNMSTWVSKICGSLHTYVLYGSSRKKPIRVDVADTYTFFYTLYRYLNVKDDVW